MQEARQPTMTKTVLRVSDEGIDDSRNDEILGREAQEGLVEDLEPME
jgi:hypothetical protein